MTVLCAIHLAGTTYIASDSRARLGEVIVDHQQKWVVADDGSWAIGCSGMTRAVGLLEECRQDFRAGMRPSDIAGAIFSNLKADGWSTRSDPGEPQRYGVSFIWATTKGVWSIECDQAVIAYPGGTICVDGSGAGEAFGAWFAMRHAPYVPDVKDRLRTCVQAAIARDAMCGGAPVVITLGDAASRER